MSAEPVPGLLVGSLPSASAEDAMREVSGFAAALPAVPDGETGVARGAWLQCAIPALLATPGLRFVEPHPERPGEVREAAPPATGIYAQDRAGFVTGRAQLRPGVRPEDLVVPPLGYARWALASYRVQRRLVDEGALAPSTRLLVSLPSPWAFGTYFAAAGARAALVTACEAALRREATELVDSMPRDHLAVQIDSVEPLRWPDLDEGDRDAWVATVAGLVRALPADVPCGLHLCYGDLAHRHTREPESLADCVEMANRVTAEVPLAWVHVPEPVGRTDREYVAALADLDAGGTTLFLGCLHPSDDEHAARARLDTARASLPPGTTVGVSTECGLGRTPPTDYARLRALFTAVTGVADL